MNRDRLVQLIAVVAIAGGVLACGRLLPGINRVADESYLRYSDAVVDNAPPIVAIGTAIGALRGIIVDYLWIKVGLMKEAGKFYDMIDDVARITRLQPHHGQVWAFQGHNLAYNVSVVHDSQEERWDWVMAGIDLVRNEGIRYNPHDVRLHKDLAFWFAHKIEAMSDDAHLYYKRRFTEKWHYLLGEPPASHADRITWMQDLAAAPETMEEAEQRAPGLQEMLDALIADLKTVDPEANPKFNEAFLTNYARWEAIKGSSGIAREFNFERIAREQWPEFVIFDKYASAEEHQAHWKSLVGFLRKKILRENYNMEPALMAEFMELGPIDWRNGQAHALYWSRRGMKYGDVRNANVQEIFRVINNDGVQLQAMQGLARFGQISFDPLSGEQPGRFPDPRWVDVINEQFDIFYKKHYKSRGAGGERFIAFMENFMGSSVCFWYRNGERERAEAVLARLDELFGMGEGVPQGQKNPRYRMPIETFVRDQTMGEYTYQPHLAPRDVAASLQYGLRQAILYNREEVLEQAIGFAQQVTEFYKSADVTDFKVEKFDTRRLADILFDIDQSILTAYRQVMLNPQEKMAEKMYMWANTESVSMQFFGFDVRLPVYDLIGPELFRQYEQSGRAMLSPFNQAFPPPPGLEEYRAQRDAAIRAQQEAEGDGATGIDRR